MLRFLYARKFLIAVSFFAITSLVAADDKFDKRLDFNVLSDFGNQLPAETEVVFESELVAKKDKTVELQITAKLGAGWHIYSTTQKSGGPTRTSFIIHTKGVKALGAFKPDRPPKTKKVNEFPVPLEEFSDQVTWTVPVSIDPNISLANLEVKGKVKGQVCHDQQGCIPLKMVDNPNFNAKFLSPLPEGFSTGVAAKTGSSNSSVLPSIDGILALAPSEFTSEPFRVSRTHSTIEGRVKPANAKPGDTVQLEITITPDLHWHVYAYAEKDPKKISKPTLIAITSPAGDHGKPKASSVPTTKETGIASEPTQSYHEIPVTWTYDLKIPKDAKPGALSIAGHVGFQTCTDSTCDPPTGAQFSTTVQIGSKTSGSKKIGFAKSKYSTAAKLAELGPQVAAPTAPPTDNAAVVGGGNSEDDFDLSKIVLSNEGEDGETKADLSFGAVLLLALLGGFILNFMPCVLPVIGLKVMSFVQQSGENRTRTLLLNVWYSIGLLSVFWVLATATSAASLGLSSTSLGWGEQFNYDGFTIPILAVIFVMGLSFLGVWEIPIPGFASSGKANELAEKEGYAGAFFKGVITTILATPCSGPGLASAIAYCANKPPSVVYIIFTCVGLGMAMPYLLIGAFPKLARFIPKPGPWMDTFKNLMGFVLLGTVVYLFTLVSKDNVVPTIALIFALWFGCFWIGRVPYGSGFMKAARAWCVAAVFTAIVGFLVFQKAEKSEWGDFSLARLKNLTDSKTTVLVDFTADW